MLEEILNRHNIERASAQVIGNKGSGGIDGMQTDELRDYLSNHYQALKSSILDGTYKPSPVKRVEIPKQTGGGTRNLGIPTVLDRLLQQSISQWLSPQYEKQFSEQSYGFRPKRSAHQAIQQAQKYLQEGNTYIIELDLEKFFDRVHHDRLMTTLGLRIKDKRTLKLIRQYLRSGVLEKGEVNYQDEGTPQGSPLSPLLSNIVLDELDKELEQRGHSFVRYADDCSIYLKSEKSARRVLQSITQYIETTLKLKVNRTKTKISRPSSSTLLGYSFYNNKGKYEARVSEKSIIHIKQKCKGITKRSNGQSTAQKLAELKPIIRGWINYFKLAEAKTISKRLDGWLRTRLRIGKWKEWKNPKSRARNLKQLGIDEKEARKWSYSKGYCRVAHSKVLCIPLNNSYWERQGYQGFYQIYFRLKEIQLSML